MSNAPQTPRVFSEGETSFTYRHRFEHTSISKLFDTQRCNVHVRTLGMIWLHTSNVTRRRSLEHLHQFAKFLRNLSETVCLCPPVPELDGISDTMCA